MKVIDMFGVGIPVLAINYQCLSELVKHGKNGYIFADSVQLYSQIKQLSNSVEDINILKKGAQLEKKHTWET